MENKEQQCGLSSVSWGPPRGPDMGNMVTENGKRDHGPQQANERWLTVDGCLKGSCLEIPGGSWRFLEVSVPLCYCWRL